MYDGTNETILFSSWAIVMIPLIAISCAVRREGLVQPLSHQTAFMAVLLATTLVSLVLVDGVSISHRTDGTVMWGDVAYRGFLAILFTFLTMAILYYCLYC